MTTFNSVFPYDGSVINSYPLMDKSGLDKKLIMAQKVFPYWAQQSFDFRATALKKAAEILRRDKDSLATLITMEMGKLLEESKAEIEKCAVTCDYFGEHAEAFLKDEYVDAGYTSSFISYEPIGAVMAIMPWNFPFWQVFRYAAPTLMAGNVTFLKHAPNVCGCALAIEKIFIEAAGMEGVFQSVIIDTPLVEYLLDDDLVQAVTLTGSERAGSSVASIAGKLIKKQVLELGGSDAFIVLEDADLKQAAKVAVQSRMQNAGQSCIAAKRFIITTAIYEAFVEEMKLLVEQLMPGNPLDKGVTLAPMARLDLAEALTSQMKESISKGAVAATGGHVNGCNFEATMLTGVQQEMRAFNEETFGPLAAIIRVKDEQEALQVANNSRFGLGSSIWTNDLEKGTALARQIAAGSVFINSLVKSDARLPFGGIKKSGYGRELGKLGIHEFVNAKTITVTK